MTDKNIGYIINESNITGFEKTNIISENKDGKVLAEGILQTANETNRNRRYYSSEELFPQLTAPRTLELLEAGYLRAELGHPLSTDLVRQQTIDDTRTCAQFLKLWTEGNNIWARFRGTNNSYGKAFDADLKDGCKPAWSLRALGTIVNTKNGAEVKHLRVITWDQVIYPSHPAAYTQRLVSESAACLYGNESSYEPVSRIIPFSNKSVIDYIKSESANLKYVKENFDFAYNSINLDKDGKSVSLTTNDGDTIIVNLETAISNEIMNYCEGIQELSK